jgi:hypothetical protein
MLVILTQRLCEFETDDNSFERWMDKDYLPTEDCMKVCRERGKTAGEALLTNKLKPEPDGLASIRLYN